MVMTNEAAARILTDYLLHDLGQVQNGQIGPAIMVALEEMEKLRKIRGIMGRQIDTTCRNCKHARDNAGRVMCPVLGRSMQPEDYCSYGEAK